jgi:hypothetical protein
MIKLCLFALAQELRHAFVSWRQSNERVKRLRKMSQQNLMNTLDHVGRAYRHAKLSDDEALRHHASIALADTSDEVARRMFS